MSSIFINVMRAFMIGLMLVNIAHAEIKSEQIDKLIELNEYGAAEIALEEYMSQHHDSAKAYFQKAIIKSNLGRYSDSTDALNKAIALDPDLNFAQIEQIHNLESSNESKLLTAKILSALLGIFVGGGVIYLMARD